MGILQRIEIIKTIIIFRYGDYNQHAESQFNYKSEIT